MARITMREAISRALMEEMDRDPAVFVLGEEVGLCGGTSNQSSVVRHP